MSAARKLGIPAVVLATALLVPLLNVLPTLDGYWQERPPDSVFLGFPTMPGDHYQYASLTRQTAKEGKFIYEDRFTTEFQRGSYVFLYFWLVGMVQRITGLGLIGVWEILRVVVGFAFLVGAWKLIVIVFEAHPTRMLAFMFVAFGGGLGWLLWFVPDKAFVRPGFPGVTDPVGFQWNWNIFSTMLLPLWILPAFFFLLAGILYAGKEAPRGALRWIAGLSLGPAIWFTHPHSGNVAYFSIGLYALSPALAALWRMERIPWGELGRRLRTCAPFLLSFAVVLAYLDWAKQDPVFSAVSRSAIMWSPDYSVFLYPITYGLLLPLGLLGIRWCGTLPEQPRRFLLAWLAAAFILSVNPWWAGAKHQFMVFPPLAILAAHGLTELRGRSAAVRRATHGVTGVLLALLVFANAPFSIFKDMRATESDAQCYYSLPVLKAMRFLEQQPPGAVLASSHTGNVIPWLTGKVSYLGHWLLTINSSNKTGQLYRFFQPGTPLKVKQKLLDANAIRYIFYGPSERSIGWIDRGLNLSIVYDHDDVTIYKVP